MAPDGKDPFDQHVRRRNFIWGVIWPGVICAFAIVGSMAFVFDSEVMLGLAYLVFGLGFPAAMIGGVVFQSQILRFRLQRWCIDDSFGLYRLIGITVPPLFATSLFFLELSDVWKDLPESSAILRLIGTALVGGTLLWIGLAFAIREAAKARALAQRTYPMPFYETKARLTALITATSGVSVKEVRHPFTRHILHADFITSFGTIRVRRFGSRKTMVQLLDGQEWKPLAALVEKTI